MIEKNNVKKFLIYFLIVTSALNIYMSAYLPYEKAKKYIVANNLVNSIGTPEQFKQVFNDTLNFYSPVGQEEVVRYTGTLITNGIAGNSDNEAGEKGSLFVINYVEPYFIKNNARHIILLSGMYTVMWKKYKKEEYYNTAEKYYLRGLSLYPKLPPLLYGIFELYASKSDKAKMTEIASKILTYWPDDEGVKKALQ